MNMSASVFRGAGEDGDDDDEEEAEEAEEADEDDDDDDDDASLTAVGGGCGDLRLRCRMTRTRSSTESDELSTAPPPSLADAIVRRRFLFSARRRLVFLCLPRRLAKDIILQFLNFQIYNIIL